MLSWLGKKLLDYTTGKLNAGDVKPTLRMDAGDVEFTFPGDSSWAGVFRGKRELRPWLERFVEIGLQIYADEGDRQGRSMAHHDLHPRSRPAGRARRRTRVRQPLRDLGPLEVGPAQAVRGLRGHAEVEGARRVARAARTEAEGSLIAIDRPDVIARELRAFVTGSEPAATPAPHATSRQSSGSPAP